MRIEKNLEFLKNYLLSYELEYEADFTHRYITAYNSILKINEIKETALNKEDFITFLDNSKKAFSLLNRYDKNNGNLKLLKRVEQQKQYFMKYLNFERIPPKQEIYFNNITDVRLPTIENVLTILKHNFYVLINYQISNKKISKEMSNDIIYDLFKIKKFRSDLRYKEICYKKNGLLILTYNMCYKKLDPKEIYSFNIA